MFRNGIAPPKSSAFLCIFTSACLPGQSRLAEACTEIGGHEVGDLAEFKPWQAPAASGGEGSFRYNGIVPRNMDRQSRRNPANQQSARSAFGRKLCFDLLH